ncbi:MAG TPA: hypothetical protein VJ801_06365 [Polyangia bacterium]|nr:hypothetical protein [Polyangia bacterium]
MRILQPDSGIDEAEDGEDSADVGVDGESLSSKRIQHHAASCLQADSGQFDQDALDRPVVKFSKEI